MKNISTYLIVLFLLLGASSLYAQEDSTANKTDTNAPIAKPRKERFSLKDKLVLGGTMGLGFNPTNINLSPVLGYKVTDDLVLGLGVTYMYTSIRYYGVKYDYSVYGGRLYGRQKVFENFYAQAEYEVLNVENYTSLDPTSRKWIGAPLVGATYVQPLGARSSIVISVLFNLNYKEGLTPYTNPIFRLGFNL
ncbi:MAG: hypothetical protein V4714_04715 [Bacteroidota bacterium]